MRRKCDSGKLFKNKRRTISLGMAVLWIYSLLTGPALAAPQGGVVTSGAAAINQAGNVTNINQSTQKAAINWQSFSTKPYETVNFNQPNVTSITLNRVIGNERSVLEGALNANGRVFLINSNGILMTGTSSVNTAGFLASTLNITDADFNAGRYVFKANGSTGSVINMGTIAAKNGGYIALLGNNVSNQGVISATKGTVAMASGDRITLNFNGDSLMNVTIDEGTLNSLVENKQAIYADGGRVILTAKAADDLLSAQVNNSGVIQARTVDDLVGDIQLLALGGTVNVAGTLDASAPNGGNGGFIETSGNKVKIADGTVITTKSAYGENGTWLIDPTNFTIVAGSSAQTDSGIGADTLAGNLANGNVGIATSASGTEAGDININDMVMWYANNTLSLTAANDVNVNAAMVATGASAGLTLNAGNNVNVNKAVALTGDNASFALNAVRDININNAVSLNGASATLVMNYGGYNGTTVTTPASGTNYNILTKASYSGAVIDPATGYPVAQVDPHDPAKGGDGVYGSITFTNGANTNGLKINGQVYNLIHDISTLDLLDGYNSATSSGTKTTLSGHSALAQDLDATGTTYSSALISTLAGTFTGLGHTISNLNVINSSSSYTGLIGRATTGSLIRDIGLVNANITGVGYVGALAGYASGATISGAYSTGTVSGSGSYVGGLIGYTTLSTTVTGSYSDADATITPGSGSGVGGLIGTAKTTTITNSHATGKVTGTSTNAIGYAGGLVGQAYDATVSNSYATSDVTSTGGYVGGLIGSLTSSGAVAPSVTNSFATGGRVTGIGYVGTGVTGTAYVGGLLGDIEGYNSTTMATVDNCYATGDVTATTGRSAGGLIGSAKYVNISNTYAMGDVTANGFTSNGSSYNGGTGGLVGSLDHGSITNSHATGKLTADGIQVGGLIGYLTYGSVTNSYATGNVTGQGLVGGLVGYSTNSTISYCWESGDVNGINVVGGLVGEASGTIENSYADGNVNGTTEVGGLVGMAISLTIADAYEKGSVNGTDIVGGLVGYLAEGNSISDSYVSGRVTGTTDVGGLFGYGAMNDSYPTSITNTYWNVDSTGQTSAIGATAPSNNTNDIVMTNVKGLSKEQWNDLPYYMNGTIDQVLGDRAAAQAAAQAAADAAAAQAAAAAAQQAATEAAFAASATTQAGQTAGQSLQPDTNPSRQVGAAMVVGGQQPPSIDSHIVFADSASYSAGVKSISAEGVELELDGSSRK